MGQSATKPKDTKSSQRLEEKTKETRLPPIRVVDTAATKPKDNKYPHWHRLEEKADKTGLPYITDVHRTGKELGRGQSSVVEEVVYNGEVCAMKVPATSHMKYTLLEEAKILASLKHPHIMKLIGVTAIGHDERIALVLEKGTTTLRHFLSSFQKEVVPLQLKAQILQQVSKAVHYLHSQEPPIVHGDITGTNIFLTDQYQVKLGDFGSARRREHAQLHGIEDDFEAQPRKPYRLSPIYTNLINFDPYGSTYLHSLDSGYSRTRDYLRFSTYDQTTSSDIFALGVLIIEVISHQQPVPKEYINLGTSVLYTEYQRRQEYIDQFSTEEKKHFTPTIQQCLTANHRERPQASHLVDRIQQIKRALGISNKLVTAGDLNLSISEPISVPLQKTADIFKELHQFKLDDVRQTGVELGGGSFSVVYEVEWGQRTCAAKHFVVFGHRPEATDRIAQSLVRECKHWLELKHLHIVETLGWCKKETSTFPIIVMEKMDTSLKHHLDGCTKDHFPLVDKVGILFQVATGIKFLHTRSPPLIHGDITANNVMLTGCPPHCTAKLADFGLTRVFDITSITPQSIGRGTYAYISPEFFIQPPAITEKTDNFCFGILLIHTVTHNYPIPTAPARFKGGDQPLKALTELERRQQHIGLFTLQERHCLEDIIRPCLEQDPEERPTSTVVLRQMAAVKETLAAQVEGPSQEKPPSCTEHPMAKRRALSQATAEDAPSQVEIVHAIKQLSADYESRFTADWCLSIIRAEEVLSEYAVTDIEAAEHPIKRTAKLFHYLQQVEFDNIKRFCLSIVHNSAFPPGTPEHEFARSLLIKIEPKPKSSNAV